MMAPMLCLSGGQTELLHTVPGSQSVSKIVLTGPKLQAALVYDILPPNTAVTDYAIGIENLSANRQFFVGVQMAVSL